MSSPSNKENYVLKEEFVKEINAIKHDLLLLKSHIPYQLPGDLEDKVNHYKATICKL